MRIETEAIHAGHHTDPTTGALIDPIYLSTTYERQADGEYMLGYAYTRESNPNRQRLEERVTVLEGGRAGAAFASGSVAAMTLFQALSPGDHVLAPNDFYFGIRFLLQEIFIPWGLEVSFVDMTDLQLVEDAIREYTKLLIVETPSNPLLQVADIQGLANIAHGVGAYLVCDNTVATPGLQKPLALGADLVTHATTKYLSGHSDVLNGLIITREETELWQKIKMLQTVGGAVPSPFDCWLALRGIQTFVPRVQTQSQNALRIAQFLDDHPAVEQVHYPGLASHPGYAIAQKQMSGFGGLLSVQVRGGCDEAMAVAAKVKLFTRATSFGGTHSTLEHRASVEAEGTKTPQNLLRVSIGLEHVDDLITDLQQALSSEGIP